MRSDHLDVVAFLTSRGASAGKTALTTVQENASTELCEAASKGDVYRLKQLVKVMSIDVNQGDYDKRTAIHLAASEGLLEVVTCLVTELGADPSPVDRWGNTPLDDAVRSKHEHVAAFLRSNGGVQGEASAPPSAPRATAGDLCDAAFNSDLPRLREYISEQRLDVNTGDYDRRTALHLAASEGLLEVATYLIDEAQFQITATVHWARNF